MVEKYFHKVNNVLNLQIQNFFNVYNKYQNVLNKMTHNFDILISVWEKVNYKLFTTVFLNYEKKYAHLWMQLSALDQQAKIMDHQMDHLGRNIENNMNNKIQQQMNSVANISLPKISVPDVSSISNITVPNVSSIGNISVPTVSSIGNIGGIAGPGGIGPIAGPGGSPFGSIVAPGGIRPIGGIVGPAGIAGPGGIRPIGGIAGPGGVVGPGGINPIGGVAGPGGIAPFGTQVITQTSRIPGLINFPSPFTNVKFLVSYPSKFNFNLSLPTSPGNALNFSVVNLFGYLQSQYTLVSRNLNLLVYRNEKYYLQWKSGRSQLISMVIIDLLRHRHSKMFSYLGHIRMAGGNRNRYPVRWNALNSTGGVVYNFSTHSFNYEFNYLAKYFVTHMSRVTFQGSLFGFYDWYGNWVLIKDTRITQYFLTIKTSLAAGNIKVFTTTTPGKTLFRTSTHGMRPLTRTVHYLTPHVTNRRSHNLVFNNGQSNHLMNVLNVNGMGDLFKDLHKHLHKHGHHGGHNGYTVSTPVITNATYSLPVVHQVLGGYNIGAQKRILSLIHI